MLLSWSLPCCLLFALCNVSVQDSNWCKIQPVNFLQDAILAALCVHAADYAPLYAGHIVANRHVWQLNRLVSKISYLACVGTILADLRGCQG